MYDARNLDAIASALIDLTGCLNSPRQDDVLLGVAGVSLDRALFPLLVRLHVSGPAGVADLAGQAGRDPSTVSRQLARLEQLGLVARPESQDDRRVRNATVTPEGMHVLGAITAARRQLLAQLVESWSAEERRLFPLLVQRLADAMKARLDE